MFSLQAGRNVAPAIIMLAPFVALALDRNYGERLGRLSRVTLPRVILIGTMVLAVLATGSLALLRPALVDGIPFRIIDALKGQPGTVRVLNSYNVGGVLTGFGAPEVSVAIDGRTDNYDPTFVHRYLAATTKLVEWREVINELDVDFAVVGRDGVLATELTHAGWSEVMTDGDFVLLSPPHTSGARR
jgi:hypothetical protein